MTRLLLIRHGQSDANLQKVFAGSWDCALTPLGVLQAELTADYLVSRYHIKRIYSSDLQRAYITAEKLAEKLELQIATEKELREINAGQWERTSFDCLPVRFSDSYSLWLHDIGHAVCDGGESVSDLHNRVVRVLKEIAQENIGSTVAVFTHGTPIRAAQCYFEGKSLDSMKNVNWVSNASITELIFVDNRLQLGDVSYDAHLGGLTSVLPANC